jgi:hypothetical protein
MKIRNGFVSNSSSSSFICAVCGEIENGYGICAIDLEMEGCVNGHYYHKRCLKNSDIKEEVDVLLKLKEQEEQKENIDYDYDSEVPSKFCPVCQRIIIPDSDVLLHLLKIYNLDIDDVKSKMRQDFKNKEEK